MKALKLGGSVLTDKSGFEELRGEEVRRIAAEVSRYDGDLVLVHGAGSFGHPHVERHLTGGAAERLMGASKTHSAVAGLTHLLVSSLEENGVPALPVRPLSCSVASEEGLQGMYLEPVRRMLDSGVVPVLHGDVVMSDRDVEVVSGDDILVHLVDELEVGSIGFGTDVTGVLDGEGELIPLLRPRDLEKVDFFRSEGSDVTGGMEKKVRALLERGVGGRIFDATVPGNVEDFLNGKEFGTEVRP